ncbi:hypothetical protein GLYMA_19G001800v4 [Glycine max]|uniref:Uncharacterized protein n=1 Tax=Glycine max TaxID=3847 RepID=K7MVR6_SOYBN|nr:hypothetical protein GYH30_051579 [Glycine max]KRG93181.1 hypothetical protein GLYMA_19G001800v4 [Glycine max]
MLDSCPIPCNWILTCTLCSLSTGAGLLCTAMWLVPCEHCHVNITTCTAHLQLKDTVKSFNTKLQARLECFVNYSLFT